MDVHSYTLPHSRTWRYAPSTRRLTTLRVLQEKRYAPPTRTAHRDYADSFVQLISSLHHISRTFERKLSAILPSAPSHLLALPSRTVPQGFPSDIISPIFPILTSAPIPLANFLRSLGYAARPIPYPVVPRGQERVRVVAHARNTEAELDELIAHLLEWSLLRQAEEQKEREESNRNEAVAAVTRKMGPPEKRALFTFSLPGTALHVDVSIRSTLEVV